MTREDQAFAEQLKRLVDDMVDINERQSKAKKKADIALLILFVLFGLGLFTLFQIEKERTAAALPRNQEIQECSGEKDFYRPFAPLPMSCPDLD